MRDRFERTCYQKLDEPILVWMGLEFRQIVLGISAGAGTAFVAAFIFHLGILGLLLGFGVGAGILFLFRFIRSGGPGYIFSRLYRAGLLELLPPGIRPRYLLPLPPVGRDGRFRLSPVQGEERNEGISNARKYYGR